MLDFEKMFEFKKSCFGSYFSVKRTYFAIFMHFWKAWFLIENFLTCQILIEKKYNVSDFELEKVQPFRFWIKKFLPRQILNQKFFIFFNLNF